MISINTRYKDTLFSRLFSSPDKQNLLELYKSLHPEDIDAVEEDLKLVNIENTFVNDIYNDLGFLVRDHLIVLLESQSTWSPNILIRMFIYLARSYQDYIISNEELKKRLYSNSKLTLPQPELYVLYAGNQNSKPDTMSLSQEFFNNSNVDLVINIIYADSNRRDIIGQYLAFCMIVRQQYKIHKDLRVAIREAIRICIEQGNLADYLSEHRMEVEDIMFSLLTQEEAIECYGNNMRDEGLAEGLTATLIALKEFYPDFESLYTAKIATSTTYSHFLKEEVKRIYDSL